MLYYKISETSHQMKGEGTAGSAFSSPFRSNHMNPSYSLASPRFPWRYSGSPSSISPFDVEFQKLGKVASVGKPQPGDGLVQTSDILRPLVLVKQKGPLGTQDLCQPSQFSIFFQNELSCLICGPVVMKVSFHRRDLAFDVRVNINNYFRTRKILFQVSDRVSLFQSCCRLFKEANGFKANDILGRVGPQQKLPLSQRGWRNAFNHFLIHTGQSLVGHESVSPRRPCVGLKPEIRVFDNVVRCLLQESQCIVVFAGHANARQIVKHPG